MDTIQKIYQKVLVITPGSDVFSLQILLLSLYVIALVFSMSRAHKDQERITDFLSTITATVKYALTAVLVETFLEYARHPDNINNDFASIQNIYLYLFFINLLFVFFHYQIHLRFSFVYGRLYQVVKRIFLWHGFLHLIIWFKLVVFDIQNGLAIIDYAYSFLVVYLNITLFVAMIKPSLLKKFYIELILAPMYVRSNPIVHVQRK
ncbi:hypothetical protein N478_03425 [Pseudoalteromonas luteoviolacea S4060-1]|uniref:Uncharacterized protein n=1 Tax=Pseudoalteromonas luteoviolacea S4060-1 TaxID=1365257 RepID=A0A162C790_9GAMM|nr:hypothetical protein N478_03425 [Pseudoalteromonas luteoviolacea S4060-1]